MASRRVCTVCCKQQAQYTCPRCHKVYCSSACYKEHSSTCSEAFYREQATAQLKSTRAGPEQTQEMMAVLQRLHEQQQADRGFDNETSHNSSSSSTDSDSDGDIDLDDNAGQSAAHKLLKSMSPAVKQLLKRAAQAEREGSVFEVHDSDLTQEVLQELESLNLKGQLSHLVTPWDPWWHSDAAAGLQLNSAGQRVVQDMQQLHQQVQQQQRNGARAMAMASSSTARDQSGVPLPSEEPLPSMQELAGQAHRPSELLPWQLLQLLVVYCAVMRQYNGEPEAEEGWEAAQQLLLLAPPLVQAALASSRGAGSSSTSAGKQGDAAGQPQPQPQQQQKQQQKQAGLSIPPPESVRGACIQLLDAAAAADAATSSSQLHKQLAAAAAAVSSSGGVAPTPERRALLQVATADALKLLQLGRSAVVLALTDSRRLLVGGKECVKHSLQQHSGTGLQLQRQRRQLQQLRQGLSLAGQKVWYFMVWCNEQAPLVYQVLADELGRELQGQQAMAQPASGVSLTGKTEVAARVEAVAQKPVVVVQSASQLQAATDSPVAEQVAAKPPESGSSGLYDLD